MEEGVGEEEDAIAKAEAFRMVLLLLSSDLAGGQPSSTAAASLQADHSNLGLGSVLRAVSHLAASVPEAADAAQGQGTGQVLTPAQATSLQEKGNAAFKEQR
jgi:hypothetical protein